MRPCRRIIDMPIIFEAWYQEGLQWMKSMCIQNNPPLRILRDRAERRRHSALMLSSFLFFSIPVSDAAPPAAGINTNLLVRPGLTADRTAQWVRVEAVATGMAAQDLVEFMLISEKSGHDYEAFAVSRAQPSEVHRALEYIGIPAGTPVDPETFRFWPKGEPVHITCSWTPAETNRREHATDIQGPIRMEELILDTRTRQTLSSHVLYTF